ncbi:MAG: hypothetical protein KDC83_15630, partial [Flavobacteriales bacterium]|nr:hypothetical protein [Flavobacteriales bacterium]
LRDLREGRRGIFIRAGDAHDIRASLFEAADLVDCRRERPFFLGNPNFKSPIIQCKKTFID